MQKQTFRSLLEAKAEREGKEQLRFKLSSLLECPHPRGVWFRGVPTAKNTELYAALEEVESALKAEGMEPEKKQKRIGNSFKAVDRIYFHTEAIFEKHNPNWQPFPARLPLSKQVIVMEQV